MRGSLIILGFVLFAMAVRGQVTPGGTDSSKSSNTSTNLTNESNDPLTLRPQVLLQNYLMPAPRGFQGRLTDEELLRLYWPFAISGVPNIVRIYQPLWTKPLFPNGRSAGLGDTTVFDLALHTVGKFTVGGGPLLVIPSASHDNMGDGKWQAGFAGSMVTERNWGLVGTIITYSHSFSGHGANHPSTQVFGVEPLVHYNFSHGYYLRSSGIWNFDYGNHVSVIPIGFGAGKVTKLRSGIVMNVYLEPQRAVHYTGIGAPIWQIFMGVNFQFGKKR